MESVSFFSSEEIKDIINRLIYSLSNKDPEIYQLLCEVLTIIKNEPQTFDTYCQFSIRREGALFKECAISFLKQDSPENNIFFNKIYAFIYALVSELDISRNSTLSDSLEAFLNYSRDNSKMLPDEIASSIEYSSKWLHVGIIKKIANDPAISNYITQHKKNEEIVDTLANWDKDLSTREYRVNKLKDEVEKYENAFNFVGLYQGFNELHQVKLKEFFWTRLVTFILAIATTFPFLLKIHINQNESEKQYNLSTLFFDLIPYIAATFLIIYFFRISYRVMDSLKSQILQIELRKTLCQFIQSYSDFSSEAVKKSPETLKKFESVIFSNIVTTSEKIPSTFDGIESITNLISLVKSTK